MPISENSTKQYRTKATEIVARSTDLSTLVYGPDFYTVRFTDSLDIEIA